MIILKIVIIIIIKSTFCCQNMNMSYLYHVVALTLLYLLVLVALQFVLLFLSYKVSVHVCNSLKWHVLPPTHIVSQLLIHSYQCQCSAPYTCNGYQRFDEEGSISQQLLGVSRWSRYHKVGHDLYNKNIYKRFLPKFVFCLFGQFIPTITFYP